MFLRLDSDMSSHESLFSRLNRPPTIIDPVKIHVNLPFPNADMVSTETHAPVAKFS